MTHPIPSSILDTHMGLPHEGHGGYSGADASIESVDPDAAIADEILNGDQDQGSLDFHGQATSNKHQRYAHGGQ